MTTEAEIMRAASYAVLDFIRQHGRRPTEAEEQAISWPKFT